MKTEPHQKCSSSKPPVIGPRPMPSADTPAQTPIALPRSAGSVNTLVMIDSVAGMMNAPPMPISARVAISTLAERRERRQQPSRCRRSTRPTARKPVAAEAVAEAAGGEQQAGEDERVGVDDPLQLAGGGAEAALARRVGQRRERDVEDRVVERDHDQADAQHQQRQPPAAVDDVGILQGGAHSDVSIRHRIETQPSR